MARNMYDLSHPCWRVGRVGRIQTFARFPVHAGQSLEIGLDGLFRMAPLRNPLIMDSKLDFHAFYIPLRHIHQDTWVDFIKEGIDETQSFEGSAPFSTEASRKPRDIYLTKRHSTVLPAHIPAGYNRIWNRYYRDPRDDLELPDDWFPGAATSTNKRPTNWPLMEDNDDDCMAYGYRAGRLKYIASDLNGFSDLDVATDRTVSTASDTLDLVDLERIRVRYRSETDRDWFVKRYTDILSGEWGTGVNIDADERPELLYSKSEWMSGGDLDVTDDQGAGRIVGKSMKRVGFSIPRRSFNEHGHVWLLGVMRFNPIFSTEEHFLDNVIDPSWLQWAVDPKLMATEPPAQLNAADYFADGSNTDLGLAPYGDWWRHHPPAIHTRFDELYGYSLISEAPKSKYDASYERPETYDSMFMSTPRQHWSFTGMVRAGSYSDVPSGQSSIYAGA